MALRDRMIAQETAKHPELPGWNQTIAQDPQLQAIFRDMASRPAGSLQDPRVPQVEARLKQLGITVPKGYWLSDGQITNEPNRFLDTALPLMVGTAFGGLVLADALAGGGTTTALADVASSAPPAAGGGGAATTTGVTAASAAPGAIPPPVSPPPLPPPPIGGPSLWSKYVAPIISTAVPAITNLAGTKLQVDANQQAAAVAAKAAQDALDWQKSVYATRQKQLAIPIGVGNGATLELGNLLGIPAPAGGYQPDLPPEPAQAPLPATTTAPTSAPTAPGAAPQMVSMKAPDGTVKAVPPDQVAYYESKGATRVAA